MAIVLNGTGSISGLSAGGLPDSSITTDDIASNAVTQAKLGTGVAGTGPAFSAYLASNSGTISDSTWVKITLNTEEFDTNSNFDSSTNYRFTPTVAGYYQINASIQFDDTGNPVNDMRTAIYKNGSIHRVNMVHTTSGDVWGMASVSALIYMNGSTDYLELYGQVYNGGGSAYIVGFGSYKGTWMDGYLVRAA